MKRLKRILAWVLCLALMLSVVSIPQTASAATDFTSAKNAAYSWLCAQQVPSGNAFVGLVDSFEDYWGDGTKKTIEYTYDQAVAAIAFLLMGDTNRAKQVLNMLQSTQDSSGYWLNSYWWNNGYGEEIRAHVGPCMWVALAVMNYEKITGDTSTYHNMAIKTIDWCLQFQKSNGALSGGLTTWDSGDGSWTNEVWSSTEQNEDAYAALVYFASTTSSKASTYSAAATKIKSFLDNVVWDSSKNRWYGGWKNNTNTIDPFVPMDVNPWGVMALGTSGTRNYSASISYVENANGNPGTLSNPRYAHTLSYAGSTISAYDFDWESDGATASSGGTLGADIWFEGSAFMSCAYSMLGNETKSDAILSELIKKQGKDGSLTGGLPYCLNGTNNNYWTMAQQNCVSSTGWFIIAASKWNPFTAKSTKGTSTTQTAATPTFNPAGGTYTSAQNVTLSCGTNGATIYYTTNGSNPTTSSTKYTGAITVSSTQTIKAIAVAAGYNNSSVASATYTINTSGGGGSTNMNLVWSDEFSGSSLDTSKWVYDTGTGSGGWGNNELEYYTNRTDNVKVTNGNLVITAKKENYGGKSYTSGRIKTQGKASWKYGKMEASIKIPTGQGIWPAFWMLGDNINTVGWPKCGEIDIMEHVNNEPNVNGTIHWDYNGYQYYGLTSSNLDFSQYHVYTIEWDSSSIKWYVDGTKYCEADITINDTNEFHNNFYFLLNLAVGGNWPGSPNSSTTFPALMYVDYVRVYQAGSGSGGGGTTPTAATPSFSPAGGTYTSAQNVTLSCATAGSTIYYTTDGTTPTTSSTKYTGAINVSSTKTINAIAVASGYNTSAMASATFTINSSGGGGSGSGTTWYLFNTSASGVKPSGQVLQTSQSGTTGWQPTYTIPTTSGYWYAPTESKTYSAGTWNFTLWTNSPGTSTKVNVEVYKVNKDGKNAVLVGNQIVDVNASGSGNHATTFTFNTTNTTTLSNQRLMVKITKVSGGTATMCYNTNDFATKLITP